jgi:hypothetical protein
LNDERRSPDAGSDAVPDGLAADAPSDPMADPSVSHEAEVPVSASVGPPPDAGPADGPVGPPPDAVPARPPASRWRAIIVIGVIVAFLGIVLFVVRNNVSADDLQVADCFNVPSETTVQTVEKQPCTESHDAEVIFVGDYSGDSFPIALSLDSFIEDNCVAAFEAYVGQPIDSDPSLFIGYFHPTRDGWDSGDRAITCYVGSDDGPMSEPLKA